MYQRIDDATKVMSHAALEESKACWKVGLVTARAEILPIRVKIRG
jgi:hypothetical protein